MRQLISKCFEIGHVQGCQSITWGRKNGFKLNFDVEVPSRKQRVELVNHLCDWKTLFKGNKLIGKLDVSYARTPWNQTVGFDTTKAAISGFFGKNLAKHKDSIQVLRPTKLYHFDDACVFFVKNNEMISSLD